MQDPTVSPEALGRQSIRRLRLAFGGIVVLGVWIACAVRSYHHSDGPHDGHFAKHIGWGALVAAYLAFALAVATKMYDSFGLPGEAVWRKWFRASLCLALFVAVPVLLYLLALFILIVAAAWSWGHGGPG
jgi:hypothetical protein